MMIFEDLKVLELASVLAGPSVGQFFGELGAEVIKVENLRTQGDVTRTWKIPGEKAGDLSAYFCSVNWGKKSVAIDLSQPDGKSVVHKLASRADLVIASYKPGDSEKLGVDYKTLSGINPRLIYGQITGYGPLNKRVGYDAVIQAEAGFMDLNGERDGLPVKMPVALMDVLAAHHLKEGLLLSLLKREKSGKGDLVEVSLIQAAVSSLANQASNWLVANQLPHRQGSAHPNIAPYGEAFETADGQWLLLAVGNDQQFANLCSVLEMKTLSSDERFASNQNRVENRVHLNQLIAGKIMQFTSDPLLIKINALKIPAGLIKNLKEVFEMPEARELLMRSNDLTGVRTFVAGGDKPVHLLRPPHLGEHTGEVLKAVGLSPKELDRLTDSKVIR